jgi:hypothetical protein
MVRAVVQGEGGGRGSWGEGGSVGEMKGGEEVRGGWWGEGQLCGYIDAISVFVCCRSLIG